MGIAFGYARDPDYRDPGASWSVTCKSDPRFNMSGYASNLWDASAQMDKAIEARIAALQLTEVPSDIEISAFKD